MKLYLINLIIIISPLSLLYGQTDSFITPPYTLSGTVVSGINNEPLYGAHLLSSKRLATKTNETGLFDIIVTENDTLKISYIGFKTLIFIAPKNNEGKYLTKFTLYKDSISLKEVEIFPWPSYDDFKKAFEELDFKDQEIKMAGVKMYQDRNIEPWEFSMLNLFTNPLTLMYDRLLDKKAKLNRRINRRREIIEKAAQKQSLEN